MADLSRTKRCPERSRSQSVTGEGFSTSCVPCRFAVAEPASVSAGAGRHAGRGSTGNRDGRRPPLDGLKDSLAVVAPWPEARLESAGHADAAQRQ